MPSEQIIDGILHFELHGEMVPYGQQELTRMLMDLRGRDHIAGLHSELPVNYADPTGCDEG